MICDLWFVICDLWFVSFDFELWVLILGELIRLGGLVVWDWGKAEDSRSETI